MGWLAPGWWQKRSKWPGLGYMGGVSRTGFCTGRIWVERKIGELAMVLRAGLEWW